MATSINTKFENGKNIIVGANYPYIPDRKPNWYPIHGHILPNDSGFPARYNFRQLSFKIYSAFCDQELKPLADAVLSQKHPTLNSQLHIWDNIGKFSRRTPKCTTLVAYTNALTKLKRYLDVEKKLQPLTLKEASARIPQATSPGLPFIKTHPRKNTEEIIEEYLSAIEEQWKFYRLTNVLFPDCAAFARSYIVGSSDTNKIRPDWVIPLVIILQEAKFALPLIDSLIRQECCRNTAYGCEIMKGGMMWINYQIVIANKRFGVTKILVTDYNEFDSSVPAWLIRAVFAIVKEKFIIKDEDSDYFNQIEKYFIETPIQSSDGCRFKKYHGIPSGSMFTNIIGILVNMVYSWTANEQVFNSEPVFDIYFGDDSLICFKPDAIINLDMYAKCMKEVFGLEVNLKKSYWTRDLNLVHFLGYNNYNGTPYKDPLDILATMLFPQYPHNEWEYCISSALECLLVSAGCSTDVFHAAKAVYICATKAGADVEKGIKLIREQPRSLKHLQTMGVSDLLITSKFFSNINLSVPVPKCSKLMKGINVVLAFPIMEVHTEMKKEKEREK